MLLFAEDVPPPAAAATAALLAMLAIASALPLSTSCRRRYACSEASARARFCAISNSLRRRTSSGNPCGAGALDDEDDDDDDDEDEEYDEDDNVNDAGADDKAEVLAKTVVEFCDN